MSAKGSLRAPAFGLLIARFETFRHLPSHLLTLPRWRRLGLLRDGAGPSRGHSGGTATRSPERWTNVRARWIENRPI